jgi:HSP20 family protein
MSLVRYRQGHPNLFNLFFDDMLTKEAFQDQRKATLNQNRMTNKGALPASNVKETPEAFIIDMAAPGLDKSDFSISVDNMQLTIAVNKEDQKEEKTENYHRKEFHYHNFKRSFQLPENVNLEEISADYIQGVLSLQLPKMQETTVEKVRQIQVG